MKYTLVSLKSTKFTELSINNHLSIKPYKGTLTGSSKQVYKFPSDAGPGSPARPKNKKITTIETQTRVIASLMNY